MWDGLLPEAEITAGYLDGMFHYLEHIYNDGRNDLPQHLREAKQKLAHGKTDARGLQEVR